MDREQYWQSIADWLAGLTSGRHRGKALVVGVSAPQGAGKTTLTREIVLRLKREGVRAAAVSIDDFYLMHEEQVALAARDPGNPYLQHRGLPGTHDVGLGAATIAALRDATGAVRVPSYDKTRYSGQGDRTPEAEWAVVEGPLDLVLVEGWMVGFVPVASVSDPHMAVVNRALADYARWWALLDAFIWIEPDDIGHVRRWRAEAEAAVVAAGRPGMTPVEVQAFVTPYMAAYDLYLPRLRERRPAGGPYLHIRIGADRLPIGVPTAVPPSQLR